MLVNMRLKNFKSIQDMVIEFTPLTVLIGGNSSGKTTILQALDFLSSTVAREIPEYLREAGLAFEDLKSEFKDGKNKSVEFITEYKFKIDGNEKLMRWWFSVDFKKPEWRIYEKIEIVDDDKETRILALHSPDSVETVPKTFKSFDFQSSILKYYKISENEKELLALKQFLTSSTFYGVLSPSIIRLEKKMKRMGNIGNAGEWLSAFIHHLDNKDRSKLDQIVSDFVGAEVMVQTIDADNEIKLVTNEKYKSNKIAIPVAHVSDGFLRIVAFAAIKLERFILRHGTSDGALQIKFNGQHGYKGYIDNNNGLILLDEIENGINPYLAERVAGLFRDIVKDSGRQVIATTHSPMILNCFDPEEIVFLWKEDDGLTRCKKMFSTEEMRDTLEFLNPGEVWINYDRNELIDKMNSKGIMK
jgi:predicted ATPase